MAPAFEIEPASGEQQGLLLNGEFDYVTCPKWAEARYGRKPDSAYSLVPNTLHSQLGNYGGCIIKVTLQFLDDPAQRPDATCTSAMRVRWAPSGQSTP